MKKLLKSLLITALLIPSTLQAADDKVNLLSKQGENGKYGFVDIAGNWVIQPTFDDVSSFDDNGLAKVTKDGKYNLLDRDGNLLSTTWSISDFYTYQYDHFPYKLLKFNANSASLIDVTGKVLLKASNIDISNHDNFIIYKSGNYSYVVDPSMTKVVPQSVANGYIYICGGLIFFKSKDYYAEYLTVYDINGKKIIDLKKTQINFESICTSTYKNVSDKDYDILQNLYGACVPYVICYKDSDGYHVITVDGEEIGFKKTDDFQIPGKIIAGNRGKIFKLMKDSEYAAEYTKKYIDPCRAKVEHNKELIAQYPKVNHGSSVEIKRQADGRYALVRGNDSNPLNVYDSIAPHNDNFMAFNDGKVGIISRQGTEIIPFRYDYLEPTGIKNSFNEFFIVSEVDKYKFVSLLGGSSNSFDEIIPATLPDGSLGYYVTNGDKWGFTVPSPAVGHPYFEMVYDYIGDFDSSMTAPAIFNGFSARINKEGKLAEDILAPLFRKANSRDGLTDQQCIALYNKIIEYDQTLKEGYTAISYNNIGYHYEKLGDVDTAYGYYEQAKNMGNETGKSNYDRIKMNRISSAISSVAQSIGNTAAAIGGYRLSDYDMSSIQSSTGFSAPDANYSSGGGNYESQYRNWERRARANYESLTNTGYRTKQGGDYKGGSNGRSLNGGNYVRQKQALREAQRQMASIRREANQAGVNIPQSQYETVTVNY